jgi:hypothetical protein
MKESPDSAAFLRAHEQACRNVRSSVVVPSCATPNRPRTEILESTIRSPSILESFRPFSVALSDTSDFPIIQAPMDSPVLSPERVVFLQSNPSPILHPTNDYVIILSLRYAFGFKYYKYTIDGINLMFMNFLAIVVYDFSA